MCVLFCPTRLSESALMSLGLEAALSPHGPLLAVLLPELAQKVSQHEL